MTQWFFKTEADAVEFGPLRPSELLEKVRVGEIKPSTRVRKDDSAWFDAGEVGGLFEAAAKPDVVYRCPYCNKKISKPPTECRHCHMDVYKAFEQQIPREMPSEQPSSPSKHSIKRWLSKKKLK
ncbi:MAG: DUF4339 domain-containing protein [Planctomycetota bacterium]